MSDSMLDPLPGDPRRQPIVVSDPARTWRQRCAQAVQLGAVPDEELRLACDPARGPLAELCAAYGIREVSERMLKIEEFWRSKFLARNFWIASQLLRYLDHTAQQEAGKKS